MPSERRAGVAGDLRTQCARVRQQARDFGVLVGIQRRRAGFAQLAGDLGLALFHRLQFERADGAEEVTADDRFVADEAARGELLQRPGFRVLGEVLDPDAACSASPSSRQHEIA